MTGRSTRSVSSTPVLLAAALVPATLALAPSSVAHAEEPGGSIAAQFLISDGDYGGGATIDLWGDIGPLRLGGFFSFAAVPSARDWHNRTMMPAGVLVALAIDVGFADIVIDARGGIWGGASQESKLLVGGLVGGGAYLDFALDGGIAIGVGAEVLGLFGGGDTWVLEPGLRLTWGRGTPPTAEPATSSAEGA